MSSIVTSTVRKCGHCRGTGHNKRTCPMRNVVMSRGSKTARKPNPKNPFTTGILKYTKKKREKKKEEENKEEKECCICYESCCNKATTQLECGHEFHTKCIFTWLSKNNSCPLCRKEVDQFKKQDTRPRILPSVGYALYTYESIMDSYTDHPNWNETTDYLRMGVWYSMFKERMESATDSQYNSVMNYED